MDPPDTFQKSPDFRVDRGNRLCDCHGAGTRRRQGRDQWPQPEKRRCGGFPAAFAGAGVDVQGVAADLSTAEGCQVLFDACPQADILVNNLGIFDPVPFDAIPDSEWQRFFDVNVMSGVRLARHYVPAMKAANWGRIVFISSESGINTPGETDYGMTKSAQLAVSRGLAQAAPARASRSMPYCPAPTRSGVGEFLASWPPRRAASTTWSAASSPKAARPQLSNA